MRRYPLQSVKALVVQGQRIPMRLGELDVGPHNGERQDPHPSLVAAADPQHAALGHDHGAARTADQLAQLEAVPVGLERPTLGKNPLARFEPRQQQVHPWPEVVGAHLDWFSHGMPGLLRHYLMLA